MILFLLILMLYPLASGAQTPPFLPRTGTNLIANPTFNGTSNWFVTAPGVYDATQSRTADGSGSARIPMNGRIDPTAAFAVTAGKTYTFSAYIKTTQWPPPAVSMSTWYTTCSNTNFSEAAETGRSSNSRTGVWEEISMIITPTTTGCMNIVLGRFHNEPANGAGNLWIDEVYVGEGLGFGSPPSARTPFLGLNLEVDVLGNVRVRRDGVWEDFFPFCIMGNPNRPNAYQYYSSLGFNCDGRGGGAGNLTLAKNAVSTYNPKGIMMATDLSSYLYQCDGCYGWDAGHTNLTNYINETKNAAASDRMLWWYDDNEVTFNVWQMKMDSMLVLQAQDRTVVTTGQRLHPMFMLQGNFNMARSYRRESDGWNGPEIVGTYADGSNSGGAGTAGGFDIIMNKQNQVLPAVIVNANIVTAGSPPGALRSYLYRFLQRGARAFTMWMDCYPPTNCGGAANRLEDVPWLPDVGNLRQELNALLPLLKQPHWTSWSVTHNGGAQVQVGTRDYLGFGHLLVVNDGTTSKTVTFTVSGLPYTMNSVKNYFTGASIATPSGATFTMTLPANGINSGSAVARLDGTGGGDTLPVVTITTPPGTTTASSMTVQGTATDDVGVTSLTVLCSPSCGSPTVTCTPTCGATATSVNWSANVPLQMGPNVITVTATDTASHTVSGQVTQTRVVPCQQLVAWPFDEGTGTTTANLGTATAPGTLINSPTWVAGRVGPFSLNFNGTNQYVTNTTLAWPAGQPATVELWVNTPGGTKGGAFNLGGTDNRLGCHLPWLDNRVYCDFTGAVSLGRVQTDFAPYLNTWTHVALTADTTRRALYINGLLAAETTAVTATLPALTGLDVGRYNIQPYDTYYHNGRIDDFRLYTCVRSATEILNDYLGTSTAVPAEPASPMSTR